MAKKLLVLGVALIMCMGIFTACGGNKYEAEIHGGNYGFEKNFLKEFLDAESPISDVDEWYDKYLNDELLISKSEALLIKSQSDAEMAFGESVDNDFEKEMLLYCFIVEPTVWQGGLPTYSIKNIKIDGSILRFDIERTGRPSSAPQKSKQACKLVKMKKLDVASAEFTKTTK